MATHDGTIDEFIVVMFSKRGYRPGPNPSQTERSALPETPCNAHKSPECAAISDRLAFPGGWAAREGIERLFTAHRLVNIANDLFLDLVAVEERRTEEEGLERRIRRRYAVWGDVPG